MNEKILKIMSLAATILVEQYKIGRYCDVKVDITISSNDNNLQINITCFKRNKTIKEIEIWDKKSQTQFDICDIKESDSQKLDFIIDYLDSIKNEVILNYEDC